MRTSVASEHRLDRPVGRHFLLNWRWWVLIVPAIVGIVILHLLAGAGIVMRDVCDWLSFRGWRLHLASMRACKKFTKWVRARAFRVPPNAQAQATEAHRADGRLQRNVGRHREETTMETKHTPAPWNVDAYGDVQANGEDVARIASDQDHAAADAALIATAPELLDLARAVLRAADEDLITNTSDEDSVGVLMDFSRSAIAKASALPPNP